MPESADAVGPMAAEQRPPGRERRPAVSEAFLSLRGIGKSYPGATANADVSLDVAAGEIHALLGENGAGKSTLVNVIYGLVRPDAGSMQLGGQPFAPRSPREARARGVAMVFQHFSLFDALTVGENIALGMEAPPPMAALARRIRAMADRYGLPLDPEREVGHLGAGERQRVEIVRCLLQEPRLLILDEPTSVLTPQECDTLFRTLRQVAAEGAAILFISHKLEDVRRLCEQATILRRGRVAARCVPAETESRRLAELMVNASLPEPRPAGGEPGPVLLELDALSTVAKGASGVGLRDVRLQLRAGEVLGVGGVAGNGQEELLASLSGETRTAAAALRLAGEPIGHLGPGDRRRRGLLAAPAERLGHAAAPEMSLAENALITGWMRKPLARFGILRRKETQRFATRIIADFGVRARGPQTPAKALSGGNLQKFLVGREILQEPRVLAVNQPTWGVDAAAAAAVRQTLLDLAARGGAVLLISQDLDELLAVSTRFAALNDGRLTEPQPTAQLDLERVGLMIGGAGIRAAAA